MLIAANDLCFDNRITLSNKYDSIDDSFKSPADMLIITGELISAYKVNVFRVWDDVDFKPRLVNATTPNKGDASMLLFGWI